MMRWKMAEYAPDALVWLGSRVTPDLGGVLSGIVGDQAHTYGYHRGAAYVNWGDYSTTLPEDRQYPSAHMASAIDMSFNDSKMRLYTGRLKVAADKNDPRLKYVREFYGTLNSSSVYGRTHNGSTDASWEFASSDSSHLWHIHLSILRKYCNNIVAIKGLLEVLQGKALSSPIPTPAKGKGKKLMFLIKRSDDARIYVSDGIYRRWVPSAWSLKKVTERIIRAGLPSDIVVVTTETDLNNVAGKLVS